MWFGSDHGQGTLDNPFSLPLDGDRIIENDEVTNQNTYDLHISTQAGKNTYGTNDHVYFKLFDNTGHASNLARKHQPMNQFVAGAEDDLPGYEVGFDLLSKTITKVLIFKPGADGWRPDQFQVEPSLQPQAESHFDLAVNLPGDNLDGDHCWMTASENGSSADPTRARKRKRSVTRKKRKPGFGSQ